MKTRIAITGAVGWLGRELTYKLSQHRDFELLLLGRHSGILDLRGFKIQIHEWTDELTRSWDPEIVVHLAYMTRERIDAFGEEAYIDANLGLRDRIVKLLETTNIRHLVHVSSGAAIEASPVDIYGQLKKDDEEIFRAAGVAFDINVLTARAWSLSGRFCTKPNHFLFYDVLSQILRGGDLVTLTAEGEVWRKYVDAGDFLETCVRGSLEGVSGTIDSTGDLIEAEELVHQAARVWGRDVDIARPNFRVGNVGSLYYSDNPSMNDVMAELNIRRLTIDQQIELGFSSMVENASRNSS